MENVTEILRLPSPAPKPQSLAFDGRLLWMGSIATNRLYALRPAQWTVEEEAAAPGKPYGMTVVGDDLRVICSETAEDHRTVRRFVPGHGFKTQGAIRCPDDTGSQLGYDGDLLYISQWYNRRIVGVDEKGEVVTQFTVPHGICGQVIVDGRFYLVTTDDEDTEEYWLTRVDARNGVPKSEDLARIPFAARALAYDGSRFWTNHREHDEIVAFAHP
ncbi:MAG TPA: hypothetical protein VMV82_01430 [Candidatus Dormibacteraeota bacterium]|nr:hypothetical protein [Candidatus Dormibacteraeota bacterium]